MARETQNHAKEITIKIIVAIDQHSEHFEHIVCPQGDIILISSGLFTSHPTHYHAYSINMA